MQFSYSRYHAILALCCPLSGQSVASSTTPATFHVSGTITDPTEAVIRGVKVTFQGDQISTSVTTNDAGVFEADLPLGNYTMTAQFQGFRPYHRPLFRVTAPTRLVVDVRLPVQSTCDIVIVNSLGRPATPDELLAAHKELCPKEDFFSIASKREGIPFQLYIRYVMHTVIGDKSTYAGGKNPYEDPVFVSYNLFSLWADAVAYDAKIQSIEARGNVVVVDESGTKHRADSMSYKLENGQAIQQ